MNININVDDKNIIKYLSKYSNKEEYILDLIKKEIMKKQKNHYIVRQWINKKTGEVKTKTYVYNKAK